MARASAAQVIAEATGNAAEPTAPEAPDAAPDRGASPAADAKVAADAIVKAMQDRTTFIRTRRPNPQLDVKRHGGESDFSEFAIRVPDEITPEDIELDPHYLFPLKERGVKRHDILMIYNRTFKWEGRWRVLQLDDVTQEMILSPIGAPVYHAARRSSFNWSNVSIEDMGTAGFRIKFRAHVLASGLETYADAEEFINRKKSGLS